jgi:hypothetical protein
VKAREIVLASLKTLELQVQELKRGSGTKSWRLSAKKMFWPILELPSFELGSSRRHQRKNESAWSPTFDVESWKSNTICLQRGRSQLYYVWLLVELL